MEPFVGIPVNAAQYNAIEELLFLVFLLPRNLGMKRLLSINKVNIPWAWQTKHNLGDSGHGLNSTCELVEPWTIEPWNRKRHQLCFKSLIKWFILLTNDCIKIYRGLFKNGLPASDLSLYPSLDCTLHVGRFMDPVIPIKIHLTSVINFQERWFIFPSLCALMCAVMKFANKASRMTFIYIWLTNSEIRRSVTSACKNQSHN